jgi:hypothetical protein
VRQDLISYLDEKGLVNDPDILVIPSTRHYFYDADDMKGVKTMVNLKPLNYVREIRIFCVRFQSCCLRTATCGDALPTTNCRTVFRTSTATSRGICPEKAEAYENGIESRIPFI